MADFFADMIENFDRDNRIRFKFYIWYDEINWEGRHSTAAATTTHARSRADNTTGISKNQMGHPFLSRAVWGCAGHRLSF